MGPEYVCWTVQAFPLGDGSTDLCRRRGYAVAGEDSCGTVQSWQGATGHHPRAVDLREKAVRERFPSG